MSTQTELLLQKLINQTIAQNAQELHLTAGQAPALRQDGKLVSLVDGEIMTEDLILSIAKTILSESEQGQLDEHRAVLVVKEISSLGRFKINMYYQRSTLAATFKLIRERVPALSDLGLPESVTRLTRLGKGLIIVSGPIDSGRSTLAAALLQSMLNARPMRLMSLEQPLEYLLQSGRGLVEQRQVARDVESFEAGLELIAKEDVEAIFISEIKTAAVAQAAVDLALSDRLVVALLDSDSAIRSLESLLVLSGKSRDNFASSLADALAAVVNVRLLPKKGMPGRVYAVEILLNNAPLRLALKDQDLNRMNNILLTSRQDGMQTLDQSLLNLINAGIVSQEAALPIAHDQERLQSLLR